MIDIVNQTTGEILQPLARDEAERLSIKISARLDTMADNYVAVMPMIREALTRQAHAALGYRSPGDYARERFGDALSKLDPAMRREVVQELTAAGMSTRAIGSVVGRSEGTVRADQNQVRSSTHLAETHRSATVGTGAGAATPEVQPDRVEPSAPRPTVVGIDGKTYTRPTPKTAPRRPLPDQFFDAVYDLTKNVEKVARLTEDDRFPQNAEKVTAKHRDDLIRTRDLLTQVIEQLN